MKMVIAYIRPEKLDDVKAELTKAEVFRMSVSEAMGCGKTRGYKESYRGVDQNINLYKKLRLEIGVNDNFLEKTINAIMTGAKTGRTGDGLIFVSELVDCIRIRTNERGSLGIG